MTQITPHAFEIPKLLFHENLKVLKIIKLIISWFPKQRVRHELARLNRLNIAQAKVFLLEIWTTMNEDIF